MRSFLLTIFLAIHPLTWTHAETRSDAIARFASSSPPYSIKTVVDGYIALTAICSDRRFSRLGFTFPEAKQWHEKYIDISKDKQVNELLMNAGFNELKVESLLQLAHDCRFTGSPHTESGKSIDIQYKKLRKAEQGAAANP